MPVAGVDLPATVLKVGMLCTVENTVVVVVVPKTDDIVVVAVTAPRVRAVSCGQVTRDNIQKREPKMRMDDNRVS